MTPERFEKLVSVLQTSTEPFKRTTASFDMATELAKFTHPERAAYISGEIMRAIEDSRIDCAMGLIPSDHVVVEICNGIVDHKYWDVRRLTGWRVCLARDGDRIDAAVFQGDLPGAITAIHGLMREASHPLLPFAIVIAALRAHWALRPVEVAP